MVRAGELREGRGRHSGRTQGQRGRGDFRGEVQCGEQGDRAGTSFRTNSWVPESAAEGSSWERW